MTFPSLYRHIKLYDEHEVVRPFPQLRKLASLFLRKPEYASFVRQLSVRNAIDNGCRSHYLELLELLEMPIETIEVEEIFKAAIKRLSHSEEEEKEWLKHASWRDHGDALFAILPLLNRLEKMDVILPKGAKYFERILKRIVGKEKPFDALPALTKLTDVMYSCPHEEWGNKFGFTGLFLRLPAIRFIYAHNIESSDAGSGCDASLATIQLGISNLTYIELDALRIPALL